MSIEIESVDLAAASEETLRALVALYDVLDAEDLPDDPPEPIEHRMLDLRRTFARFPTHRWALTDDGDVVAAAIAYYDVEENLDNGFGRIMVRPTCRGRGYARLLATPLLDHLAVAGRTRVETWITEGHPAETLAESLGMKRALSERRSRLLIADVDVALMSDWVDRASQRAAEYELLAMTSPFPEEHLEQYCEMMTVMNTAPLEDYEMEDEHITASDWRDIESAVMASRCQINNLTAVHKPSGAFVGYTQVKTQDLQPDLAWQWDTGVHPDHRNKGLGRWLKAEMVLRIVDDYPDVRRIDTENAASNEPMLNINLAMGFKPIHDTFIWQGQLATVRERLGA